MNLYEKLFEIQKSCTYIQKNAQGYQYKYAAGTDVIAPIRAKMDELKVMLFPMVRKGQSERGESVDDKGKTKIQFFTQVDIDFVWVNIETPEEKVIVPWYAQGVDPAEKGVGKAWTYAERYFLLKFFHIPTDMDDPDRFQEKRVEAGKRPKAPSQPGNPTQTTTAPKNTPQASVGPGWRPMPKNPWEGHLTSISEPTSGTYANKAGNLIPWTMWTLETEEFTLTTFDRGVADVAALALKDGSAVEITWKFKKSARTGEERCTAEGIFILSEPEGLDQDFERSIK